MVSCASYRGEGRRRGGRGPGAERAQGYFPASAAHAEEELQDYEEDDEDDFYLQSGYELWEDLSSFSVLPISAPPVETVDVVDRPWPHFLDEYDICALSSASHASRAVGLEALNATYAILGDYVPIVAARLGPALDRPWTHFLDEYDVCVLSCASHASRAVGLAALNATYAILHGDIVPSEEAWSWS